MTSEQDEQAFGAIARVQPRLVDLRPAAEVVAFPPRTVLHAGPPFEQPSAVPAPVANSAAAAVVFEGWAHHRDEALALLALGDVRLAPAQDHRCAVPLASVLSPSQQVQVVHDAAGHTRPAFAPLNGGSGPALRLGLPGPEVVAHLRWLNGAFADALRERCRSGIDLLPIADRALAEGDDGHGRTVAATALLAQALAPLPAQASGYLAESPGFFLNLWMAAVKCMLGAAEGVEGSTVVTAMGGNGVHMGLQLAARPGHWVLAPSSPPDGRLDAGIDAADRLPAIGDSALVEAFGLGAMAFGHSPAQREALGAFLPEPADQLARALLWKPHPAFTQSNARFGLSAQAVLKTGKAPVVALGILDRHGRRGRIGGGIFQAAVAHFERALHGVGTH
ncbi:DUF1116 domain-containing protein [Variovorax sp. KK3]|uniref:DUF1116 domain-containing protein n=1 Tax=Variovorax sp. KK3 TaxID=1855728 RepID=UPI00097CA09C|nr:DUF1116 domain-containing protein [Variovorax sp. KK3]